MTIDEQLKKYCDCYYSSFSEIYKKNIIELLNVGANIEIMYNHSSFEKFKCFVEDFGLSIDNIIQKDKYKERILGWFEYYCYKYYETDVNRYLEYICFLLRPSKIYSFELICEQIRKNNNINLFIFLVEHIPLYRQTLDNMKKEDCLYKRLIERLNNYLEREYYCGNHFSSYYYNGENKHKKYSFKEKKRILLYYGATEKEALKISIREGNYESFKRLVKENENLLEEIIMEEEWRKELQNFLEFWLRKKIGKIDNKTYFTNMEDIIFLISNKEIKYLEIINTYFIKELIEYIYKGNGLETQTLVNKIMRPDKFDEETKKIIIEMVSRTHPERANILKIRLNLE